MFPLVHKLTEPQVIENWESTLGVQLYTHNPVKEFCTES